MDACCDYHVGCGSSIGDFTAAAAHTGSLDRSPQHSPKGGLSVAHRFKGGKANRRIAEELQTSRPTVILWRKRFAEGGATALTEEVSGRGRKPRISSEKVKPIVEATLHTKPKAATHWSVRAMAQAEGVNPATVQRIWDAPTAWSRIATEF